jgi:hypothetical protein
MGETVGGVKAPNGEEAESGGRSGLFKAGLITMGVSYVTTVVIGEVVRDSFTEFDYMLQADKTIDKLIFPVIGPWAALIHNETTVIDACLATASFPGETPTCAGDTHAGSAGIFIGAMAQTTGLALVIFGLLQDAGHKGGGGSSGSDTGHFVLAPHTTAHSTGLTLTGSF